MEEEVGNALWFQLVDPGGWGIELRKVFDFFQCHCGCRQYTTVTSNKIPEAWVQLAVSNFPE